MLMAYEDGVFTIKDVPIEETRVPLHPMEKLADAQRIVAEAKKLHPEIQWTIKGTGPYGIYGQPS